MTQSKYKNQYARELIDYFYRYAEPRADGTEGRSKPQTCAPLPSLTEFAREKGVLVSDIERWREENADFARACAEAEAILKQYILQCVLDGRVSATAARFYFDEIDGAETGIDENFKITVSFEGEENGEG